MVVADNHAAHALGDYFWKFITVSKFCRFFNFTRNQMLENFNSNEWVLQTKEAYDSNKAQLEGDPAIVSVYGIKRYSPLHVLKYFHVIDGLPPDLAHDVIEGIAIDIMSQIIGHFVVHKAFTLDSLNEKIENFEYSHSDKTNEPQPFKVISSLSFKIKQIACKMWNLIRFLPLMIGHEIMKVMKFGLVTLNLFS